MNNEIKVLYIEDDAETRSLMSDIINLRGYKFFEAEKGLAGLNLAQKINPDLIIVDLLLPDMDGYEVTTLLKSHQKLKGTPVIALSGESKSHVKELTLAAGCDGFISKPINVNSFLVQIDEYLGGRRDTLTADERKLYLDKYNIELVEKLSRKVLQLESANENLFNVNKELSKSKEELSSYNDRLFYLNKLANNFRKSIEPEEILRQLPEKTIEGFKVDRCIIFQVEASTSTLIPVYAAGNLKELQKKKFVFEDYQVKNIKMQQGLIWLRNLSEIIENGLEKFSNTIKSTSFILSKLNDLGARSDSTEVLKALTDADQQKALPDKFILFIDKSPDKGQIPTYEVRILKSFIQTVGTIYENMVLYHKLLETYKVREVQAVTDELTNLYNYRYLIRELEREINRTLRFGKPFSILMMDIDYFKNYNDINGHLRGDELLQKLAKLLLEHTRKTDTVARYGGEEFLVILPGIDKKEAESIAQKIQQLIADEPFYNQHKQPDKNLTVSIGLSTFPKDGKNLKKIIERADNALYKAKRQGRNRVVVSS